MHTGLTFMSYQGGAILLCWKNDADLNPDTDIENVLRKYNEALARLQEDEQRYLEGIRRLLREQSQAV